MQSLTLAGTTEACGHYSWFLACGIFVAGAEQSVAIDVVMPRTVSTPFATTGLRAGAEIPVFAIFSLRIYAEGAVNLIRTDLSGELDAHLEQRAGVPSRRRRGCGVSPSMTTMSGSKSTSPNRAVCSERLP